ncbi:GNAT family N-acetyltransferase [Qipengyuania sp.]|uniref:GNAT family N-acetyltransferase n=1 Tax=Qipengyuania sp. TaxID=2004515 RepID=UPI0037366CA2
MATIVPLSAVDPKMIDQLLDAAFGIERRARTAYRIRHGAPVLDGVSFAALDEDEYLAGSIQLWPVALLDPAGRPHPMIMVGPVAVAPGYQGQGYGKALMAASLGALEAGFDDGAPPLPQVMIGDPDYYRRWDFTARHTGGWTCPGSFDPDRLLVRTGNPAILPTEGILGPWPR